MYYPIPSSVTLVADGVVLGDQLEEGDRLGSPELAPELDEHLRRLSARRAAMLRGRSTAGRKATRLLLDLRDFDAIEVREGPSRDLLRYRMTWIIDILELLLEHENAIDDLAADGIARVPRRFAKHSPFGAACNSLWVVADRVASMHDP